MDTRFCEQQELEVIARLFAEDVSAIGTVSYAPRLAGFAVFEDDVMFGFVERDGTAYLRTSMQSAQRFHALGSHKHVEMPYWSVPPAAAANSGMLLELAYEAADIAHITASFALEDLDITPARPSNVLRQVVGFALLAA